MFDKKGKPIVDTPGETIAQAIGFRPQRMAALSSEYRTMQNLITHYAARRSELYDRMALAKTPEDRQKVIKEAQKFNMETAKYRGFITPISSQSIRQSYLRRVRPEKKQMYFGRLSEANA